MTQTAQTREALVEVMARAHMDNICKGLRASLRMTYDQMDRDDQDLLKENIRAGFLALEAAGVRLVPVEATEEMRQAAVDPLIEWGFMKEGLAEALRAAIAASPYAKDKTNDRP